MYKKFFFKKNQNNDILFIIILHFKVVSSWFEPQFLNNTLQTLPSPPGRKLANENEINKYRLSGAAVVTITIV